VYYDWIIIIIQSSIEEEGWWLINYFFLNEMREFLKEFTFRRLLDSLKLTPKHRLVEFGG
jgi:hypothetical protein